ncbi:hypothetical protein BsIDN1_68070 [Bacillus safensis]|uniref:Cytochrome d ubiquinol oxidase subunit II n=1 Tax=Bacillus safensis TaxID=561879 RepID=A0A5S9MMG0_BACIA|nr:hypothetical protein BsIDN1_68070 [Bacillus safensis]
MMTTAQSISPNVSYGMLLFSVISFTVMYLILAILLAYLFIREIKKGAHSEEDTDQKMKRTCLQIHLMEAHIMVYLNEIWFILVAVLFVGFFFLEGFDFGVGMSMQLLGKDAHERRILINTIGPFWDANEVWLITAGGAIFFAAFPHWYATMFSGYYIPFAVLLLALIGRGVAFEFRGKVEKASWIKAWDWVIFFGSLLPPFFARCVIHEYFTRDAN